MHNDDMERNQMTNHKLLTPRDVSDLLGVTIHTLAVWRCEQRYDLPYIKAGRLVRYRREDIEAFIKRQRQHG